MSLLVTDSNRLFTVVVEAANPDVQEEPGQRAHGYDVAPCQGLGDEDGGNVGDVGLFSKLHGQAGGVFLDVEELQLVEFRHLTPVVFHALVEDMLIYLQLNEAERTGAYGMGLVAFDAYRVHVVLA